MRNTPATVNKETHHIAGFSQNPGSESVALPQGSNEIPSDFNEI